MGYSACNLNEENAEVSIESVTKLIIMKLMMGRFKISVLIHTSDFLEREFRYALVTLGSP